VPEEDAEAASSTEAGDFRTSFFRIEYHGTAATTKDMQSIRAN